MKSKPINRAKRLHENGTVTTYCVCAACRWESDPIKADDAEFEDGRVTGLSDFQRGFLAGAYNHHDCKRGSTGV